MNESIRRKKMQVKKQMEEMEERLREDGNLLTAERIAIVEMKPMDLLSSLRNGDISALQVLRAFQSKALEVTRKFNCVTEFIPEAEAWAKNCDNLPAEERGSLHGLPVSVKECINIRGMDSTLGLAKYLYNPASSHAVIVDLLKANGAVPFCKTNVPQLMLSSGCSNPVYGETKNVLDITRSPGGSSGGEGALIAGGASVLGFGTDIGGSIRIPAHFSGCVGFRPTGGRLSGVGIKKSLSGIQGVVSTVGPMGRDIDIVTYSMEVLCNGNMHSLDPSIPKILWNDLKIGSTRKLTFGYFDTTPTFPSTPGVKRAVHEAKIALEKAGHTVIPFEIEGLFNHYLDLLALLTADGGKNIKEEIRGEKVDPVLERGLGVTTASPLMKLILKHVIKLRSPLASKLLVDRCVKSDGLWRSMFKRERTVGEVTKSMKTKNIDLILSPVYAIPSIDSSTASMVIHACVYSAIFNYLNFPSGSINVTKETDEDQRLLKNYPETDALYCAAKRSVENAKGQPIGVLMSGLPWEDETVCRGMKELQEALQNDEAK